MAARSGDQQPVDEALLGRNPTATLANRDPARMTGGGVADSNRTR